MRKLTLTGSRKSSGCGVWKPRGENVPEHTMISGLKAAGGPRKMRAKNRALRLAR